MSFHSPHNDMLPEPFNKYLEVPVENRKPAMTSDTRTPTVPAKDMLFILFVFMLFYTA